MSEQNLRFSNFNSIGSDPELFFVKNGEVVPSEEVVELPVEGMNRSLVIRDGFQGELNPAPGACRQASGTFIAMAFLEAVRQAKLAGTEVSLKVGHVISDEVWKKTKPGVKKFGCSPTINSHETNFSRVTGLREKFRAAGGHIHFALLQSHKEVVNYDKLVTVMDIVLGNTCVMLDRDPDNARRRKNYGRAGEYRVKSYGMEYRVPSNFWLKHYTLWSFVSQVGRHAIDIDSQGFSDELISMFDLKKVRKAINNNDYELAKENFMILMQFIKKNVLSESRCHGMSPRRLDTTFEWLTSEDPLSFCDTLEKTMYSWELRRQGGGSGFENFINNYRS